LNFDKTRQVHSGNLLKIILKPNPGYIPDLGRAKDPNWHSISDFFHYAALIKFGGKIYRLWP